MDNPNSFAGVADTNEPDKLVSETLNQTYFIQRELGQGGVGAVYLARDQASGDPLVKQLELEHR